jgi:ribosome biogenesis protein MAK21
MKLLVDPEQVWWEIPTPDESSAKKYYSKMTDAAKSGVRSRASALYEEQAKKYQLQKEMSPADRHWLQTVLKEGTQSDKISTMLLQARESPFYSLDWITQLLAMASSTSRHESYPAMESLRDIFVLVLPPKSSGRSLKAWQGRCITDSKDLTPSSFLMVAYFEDMLRRAYVEYLKILEIMIHDQVQNGRERAMRVVFDLLLAYKCEFTETLLQLLVNKIGDPDRKVASRVIYYLQGIIEKYEELTLTSVKAVQNEATRPNAPNDKPAFYGLLFFSQVRLNESSPEVTEVLLQTYQHFLQIFLKQLEEAARNKKKGHKSKRRKLDSAEDEIPRTVRVVLLGLTRAIPFARSTGESGLGQYAAKLISIAGKLRSFPTLLQAAGLIFKIFTEDSLVDEASMQLLGELVSRYLLDYNRMADNTASHPSLFKLLYKIFAALGDSSNQKALGCLRSMVKSLLVVTTTMSSPSFAAAALLLINEAIAMKPGLRLAITFPEDQDSSVESGLFWELNILSKHYHPTVSRYATTLLQPNGEIDVGKEPEDPFASMTNSAFLESFISGKSVL